MKGNITRSLLLLFSLSVFFSPYAAAQLGYQFGRNKVQYRKFDWKILKTPHFDVYYYDQEEEGARIGARLAERSYQMLSSRIGHEIDLKIPLILYASNNDFQQTNAIGGLIPEGLRGVTESLKRRVVLPLGGSMREFTHVLTHEMVHAFQYDILGTGSSGNSLRKMPPLWVMEGLAEYYSQGLNVQTELWLEDALRNKTLPTIDEMSRIYDIRVYRLGNAIWQYIGSEYGDASVGKILMGITRTGGFPQALEEVLGIDTQQLTRGFVSYLEDRYAGEESTPPPSVLKPVTRHEGFYYNLNAVPAVSPDGNRIAFVSNRALYNDIYVLDLQKKDKPKRIVKGARSGSLEILRFLDTSLSWSHDGKRICFVAKAGEKDAVYLIDSSSGKVEEKITPDLDGLMSPDFSPDGRFVVFSGITGGLSDLYMYDIEEGILTRLTRDIYAELMPRWSPDGRFIAFVTDRGEDTDVVNLLFGDDNIALYDLETRKIEIIVQTPADDGSPSWIEDGRKLLFTSLCDGKPAIFIFDMDRRSTSLYADVTPPVSGITRYTPALSGSNTNIAVSAMDRGGWDIYLLPPVRPDSVMEVYAQGRFYSGLIDHLAGYDLPDGSEFEEEEYSITLEPDYLIGGMGFSSNLGFEGSSQLLISDMLGNHNIIIGTRAYQDLVSSDILVAYQNLAHRINFATSFFQFRNDYGLFTAPNDETDDIEFQSQIYRGGGILAGYPLDTFRRIEFGGSFTTVKESIVRQSYSGFEVTKEDLGTAKYVTTNLAYVVDNSIFGFTGPLSGRRARYSVEQSVGDLDYTTLIMDYRRYFNIRRRTLVAQRAVLAGSFGGTRQIFRIGGPYTFRGADYGELAGTKILILNTEYRFPLLPFLGPRLDFMQAILFWDMAAAWYDKLRPFAEGGRFGFHLRDVNAAYGAGVRLGMGYLVLRMDFSWQTDMDTTGENLTFFSIGSDF